VQEPAQGGWLLPGEDTEHSRRAFLRLSGFGVAAAVLTGCGRGPARKVIPYLIAPTDIVSGRAYWLATTCHGCSAACGVLAKCVDGRPIKVEGNPKHGLSKGGLCAVGQAEILPLYDSQRLERPRRGGTTIDWQAADAELSRLLAGAGRVRLLTGTQHGPSTRSTIARFLKQQRDAEHIEYDALSVSALLDAHAETHGRRALPSYRFDRAEVIVSFDADFLGTWISPVSYASDYARGRRPDDAGQRMSRHIQLEARLSLTGSAADRRVRLAPWEAAPALGALCQALEQDAGAPPRLGGWSAEARMQELGRGLAQELQTARGKSLVVCGQNDRTAQILAAYANHLLGNYGATLSVARPSLQRRGSDDALLRLQQELDAGTIDVLIVSGVNPAYDLPAEFTAALSKAKALVVHSSGQDETSARAGLLLPSAHSLESWDDGEPELGRFCLCATSGKTSSTDAWPPGRTSSPSSTASSTTASWRTLRRTPPNPRSRRLPYRRPHRSVHPPGSAWCSTRRWACSTAATRTIPGCRSCRIRSPRSPGTTTSASPNTEPRSWAWNSVTSCASRRREAGPR